MAKALLVLEDGTVFAGEAVRRTRALARRGRLHDGDDRLPGDAHRPVVRRAGARDDVPARRATTASTADDVESKRIQVRGLRRPRGRATLPSHWRSDMTLHEYLASRGHPRHHRRRHARADAHAAHRRRHDGRDHARRDRGRSARPPARARRATARRDLVPRGEHRRAVRMAEGQPTCRSATSSSSTCGVKYNILRLLSRARLPRDDAARRTPRAEDDPRAEARRHPASRPAPATRRSSTTRSRRCRSLIGKAPILGICLGHQVLGRAFGARHVQAEVRPPRRQPPGAGRRDRPRAHHVAEPRLRRRPRRPLERHRGQRRCTSTTARARACATAASP